MRLRSPLSFKKNKDAEANEKKDKDEKDEKKNKELFEELGVLSDGTSGTVSIQKVGGKDGSNGYIDRVGIDDVRQLYGTLPEYLKTQHGPGEYIVTVGGAKGAPFTQRIRIAGEGEEGQSQQQLLGLEGQENPTTMGMVLQLQIENAKLQAEKEANQGVEKTQLWGQVAQYALPFIESLFQGMKGNQQQDVVAVIKSATESIKELSEIKQNLTGVAQAPDAASGDVGTIIGAIAQALGGMGGQQPQPVGYQPQGSGMQVTQPQLFPQPVPTVGPVPPPGPPQEGSAPGVGELLRTVRPANAPVRPANAPVVGELLGAKPVPTTPTSAGTPPVPPSPPDGTQSDASQMEEEVLIPQFVESVVGMTVQKQTPKTIAEFLITSLTKVTPEDLAMLKPQIGQIVGQMIGNPLLAWDTIVQLEPSLSDVKYNSDIRMAIQNIIAPPAPAPAQEGVQTQSEPPPA